MRFVLQGMDSAAASPPDRPQSAAQYADEALSALAPGLPPADPVATVTQREVIPRDPAPEPRVILDT